MMIASTVLTSAWTTPFSPITSLPPTASSPPISHSIWIESAMSNLPSIRAWSPTTVRRVIGAIGLPFSGAGGGAILWGAFCCPNIQGLLGVGTPLGCATPVVGVLEARISTPPRGCQPPGVGVGGGRPQRGGGGGAPPPGAGGGGGGGWVLALLVRLVVGARVGGGGGGEPVVHALVGAD